MHFVNFLPASIELIFFFLVGGLYFELRFGPLLHLCRGHRAEHLEGYTEQDRALSSLESAGNFFPQAGAWGWPSPHSSHELHEEGLARVIRRPTLSSSVVGERH